VLLSRNADIYTFYDCEDPGYSLRPVISVSGYFFETLRACVQN
jgi:hypothetical protein